MSSASSRLVCFACCQPCCAPCQCQREHQETQSEEAGTWYFGMENLVDQVEDKVADEPRFWTSSSHQNIDSAAALRAAAESGSLGTPTQHSVEGVSLVCRGGPASTTKTDQSVGKSVASSPSGLFSSPASSRRPHPAVLSHPADNARVRPQWPDHRPCRLWRWHAVQGDHGGGVDTPIHVFEEGSAGTDCFLSDWSRIRRRCHWEGFILAVDPVGGQGVCLF